MAASEEPITEETEISAVYMTKVTELKRKNWKKNDGLGWRMPADATKVHKLNYKGNLTWLKRCSKFFYFNNGSI